MDGLGGGQGRLSASVEDAGEGGGGDAYHLSKGHLVATLLLHDEFDAILHAEKMNLV